MLCALGLLWSLLTYAAQAQDKSAASALIGLGGANALSELQARVQEAAMQGSALALEGAVDPDAYVVGPGDRFNIGIGGILSNTYNVTVSAGGFLDLPEAGQITAAGHTLAQVQSASLAALKEQHSNVPISVSLVQARSFYVHVSGAVPQPGRYLMLPISRVDEVLAETFTPKYFDIETGEYIFLPARRPSLQANYLPAFRNVEIRHRDSTVTRIDLVRYYIFGDTEHNPYLRDGDRIVVESFHQLRDGIRVSGDVAYPGTYDLRPGDTAADLLRLAAGPAGTARLDSVRLARTGGVETSYLNVQRVLENIQHNPQLEPGDHLVVQSPELAIARIQGRVRYPGSYSIESGKTTIQELVQMAGGLEQDANLDGAFMERSQSLDFKESARLSTLDFFSRNFAESFSREAAYRVLVDIAAALSSGGESIVLYNGDRVVFPRDEQTVRVSGQVPRPSYVPFEEGRSARYYVDQAGGPAPGSTGIFVFSSASGEIRKGQGTVVRNGDTIFVDRQDIAETPEMQQLLLGQQQNRIQTTQVIVAGITAVTSILTTYIALFRKN